MGYKRRKTKLEPRNSAFALNVTSMTDMFTILLVFLLQTYSVSDVKIELDKDITLPNSRSELNPTKALQLSLSSKEMKLDDTVIAQLENGVFKTSDLEAQDQSFVKSLADELLKRKDSATEGKILVIADSALSYDTIKKVMYTSSMTGFPNVKLATILGN
jgi:biopolymer transport protein ExbD